jgi:hypothetical protein
MKRFALVWLCYGLVAGTAAAQNAAPDSSRVILRGVSSVEPSMPAPATSYLFGSAPAATPHEANGNGGMACCDGCGQDWTDCCCPPGCGLTIFADWMYLQPRGVNAVFAGRALNCFDAPLDTHQIDFGGNDSYRVGFAKTEHDGCSEIGVSFWKFETDENDHAPRTTGTDVILPLVLLPSQITCPGSTTTLARASAGIDFDRANIDYKQYCTWNCTEFDWLVGFGYGKLEQDFIARFDESSAHADSDLHGYGLRLGGGASRSHGWISGYLHADFTLLAANQEARFRTFDVFNGKVADFKQDLDRLVPVLDLEAGLGFNVTCCMTIKVGYIYSIWWNVVTNQSFIEDVQHGHLSGGADDTLTFDGVFARIEFNF